MWRLSKSLTVFGVAALLLAGGGAYALASSSDTITVCVKHAGGGLYKAGKCAKHDRQLRWNAQGPAGATGPAGAAGATGPQGPQGPQGIQGAAGTAGAPAAVQVAGWSGGIDTIAANGSELVFAGPTATVTTTAADPTIVASGSAALAVSTGSSSGIMAICYEAASGGSAPQALDDNTQGANQAITVGTASTAQAASQTGAPGAGTWKVGICVENQSSQAWDDSDWSIGWAMVTAGAPTSQ
jgi:hypothetical protein